MRYILFLFLIGQVSAIAQTTQNLVTWISFDNPGCEIRDEFGNPNIVLFVDSTSCICGATGNGRYFSGSDDSNIILTGPSVDNAIGTVDFTLSFYFKPKKGSTITATPQVLFSKRDNCEQDSSFVVKYFPNGNQISVELYQDQSTSTTLFAPLPNTCWHHITIVRKGSETILYHNGIEIRRAGTINGQRVSMTTSGLDKINIGNDDCINDTGFKGALDEIRLYSKSLSREEVEDLYLFPDNIGNGLRFDDLKDTTIFLGGSVPIFLTETCASTFTWTPAAGVDDPNFAEPIISPDVTTTYMVEMEDSLCTQIDSIQIIVIDPATVQCGDIFLPTAFTPNDDGLNDRFGISNPFSTGEILAFDIYDRWGNIVFSTVNVLEKWDGSYRGTPVNPGVFLYRLRYRCDGVEELQSGSVTVIR
ncbi:MAG: LamG-like jellyroll fold domain-containing protein [Saprospiraceae bacterium]